MTRRLFTLTVIGAVVWLLLQLEDVGPSGRATFMLGFALLAASLAGALAAQLRLPRITGYLLTGVLFGPQVAGFLGAETLTSLSIFTEMAYAFIGLAAGSELQLAVLRGRAKSISMLIFITSPLVMIGVGLAFFLWTAIPGPLGGLSTAQRLAVAALVGVIASARSPASAIAVIDETRARGPFTETILGVSVAMDVLVILIFAVVIALSGLAFDPAAGFELGFVLSLIGEIVVSLVVGVLLGRALALYIDHRGPHLPLAVLGVCFLVYRLSTAFGHYLQRTYGLEVHLEPLLICAAAGFVIRNLSRGGEALEHAMGWISLPVYVIFFTIAGAGLDVGAPLATWLTALLVAVTRVTMLIGGTRLATRLAGDPPLFRSHSFLGFITQAGLSLALVGQIESSYPGWGSTLATVLVAVVTINQLAGPAAFKFALEKVGETGRRPARRPIGPEETRP